MESKMADYERVEDVLDAVWKNSTEFGNFKQRPSVNSKGLFFGNVPLMPAITWGSELAVGLLLRGGADCDIQCEEGNTPLHHAIQMGEFRIARMLIAHGANQEIVNSEGKRPRELCWEGEWPSLFWHT
jgi:hypothetical protein